MFWELAKGFFLKSTEALLFVKTRFAANLSLGLMFEMSHRWKTCAIRMFLHAWVLIQQWGSISMYPNLQQSCTSCFVVLVVSSNQGIVLQSDHVSPVFAAIQATFLLTVIVLSSKRFYLSIHSTKSQFWFCYFCKFSLCQSERKSHLLLLP